MCKLPVTALLVLVANSLIASFSLSGANFSPVPARNVCPPDTLLRVAILAEQPMDDSTDARFVRQPRYRGAFALACNTAESPAGAVQLDTTAYRPGDYLRVRVKAFYYAGDLLSDRSRMAQLVLEAPCSDRDFRQSARITPLLGNPEGRLAYPGVPGRWGEAAFFVQLPASVLTAAELRVYIANPGGQKLFVDDLAVELWRYQ